MTNVPGHIIIPSTGAELLRPELARAFQNAGCRVSLVDPAALHNPAHPGRLSELLDGEPALLFSVNFQGLNPLKPALEILEKARSSAAVWFVDNPWNVLAGVRDPRWKNLSLFVTDASFIAPLKMHGALKVYHLPLAAEPALFAPDAIRNTRYPAPDNLAPFVFVGRSAFPGRDVFFAGQEVPDDLRLKAEAMLHRAERPDLSWWEEALGLGQGVCWPGKKARLPAYGAETANLTWRGMCLEAAAEAGAWSGTGLDVFGDQGWRAHLPPGARLRPPVDYYTRLPPIYAAARFVICMTSLQLPQGLNQRHFDVWMAGSICLTDKTPGLALFPDELTRAVAFSSPRNIGLAAEQLDQAHNRSGLIMAWQEHIREHHTYVHRVNTVLDRVSEDRSP